MRVRVAVLGALAAAVLAAPARACPLPVAYPGDDAAKDAIAQWMARGAMAAGLPGELPVMGALVESSLTNLAQGDRDSAGYFQTRVAVWNKPPYQDFPQHPELQLQWFIDLRDRGPPGRPGSVASIRSPTRRCGATGSPTCCRPPSNTAGATSCAWPRRARSSAPRARDAPARRLPAGADARRARPRRRHDRAPRPPRAARATQHPLRRGALLVAVTCPAEACTASATATLRLPGRAHALRLAREADRARAGSDADAAPRAQPAGALRDPPGACGPARALKAKLLVAVADAAGNAASTARTVRLTA